MTGTPSALQGLVLRSLSSRCNESLWASHRPPACVGGAGALGWSAAVGAGGPNWQVGLLAYSSVGWVWANYCRGVVS